MAYSQHDGMTVQAPAARPPAVSPNPAGSPFSGLFAAMGPRAGVMAGLVVVHIALFGALLHANMTRFDKPEVKPLVVALLPDPVAPPPPAAPDPVEIPVAVVVPQITAPDPIVVTEPQPLSYAVPAPPPAPPQAVVVAAPATKAATGPVSAADLSATMIEAVPPRYPMESRRRHEQGAVLLTVLLGADGRVETISVARSSGFERLDKAALDAVRRWRWSPTLRGGEAMMVRGVVEIPFVLKS